MSLRLPWILLGGLKAQDEEDLLLFGGPKKLQRKGSVGGPKLFKIRLVG